jgi:protein associated with RNAse G/E
MVRVVYRKYDGRLHWHTWLERLGEDDHGVWLGAPDGTAWQRGAEPPVTLAAHVVLLPRDAWWVASFNAAPAKYDMYVDLSTVPTWNADEVTMVDLDLDVVRYRHDGSILLLDEDEFDAHQVAFGYPTGVIESVRRTAARLLADVATTEPFTAAYLPWLARVTRPPRGGQ